MKNIRLRETDSIVEELSQEQKNALAKCANLFELEELLGRKANEEEYRVYIYPKMLDFYDDYKKLGLSDKQIRKEMIDAFYYEDLIDKVFDEKTRDTFIESNLKEERSDDIYDFINAIYALRKDSIAKEGEYGLGNLVFKEFRNLGYMDNLRRLRREAKSKELSLESMKEDFNTHRPMSENDFKAFKSEHPEYRFEDKDLGTLIFKGDEQIGTYLKTFGEIWLNEEIKPEIKLEEKDEYLQEYDSWDLDEGKKKRIVDYRRLANIPDNVVITEDNLDEQALNNTCRINYDYPKDKLIKELLN